MKNKNILCLVSIFFSSSLMLFFPKELNASVVIPKSEIQLIKEAELIFEGTVTKIEYRKSDKTSKEDQQVPHTFVTFKINKIFKGKTKEKDIIVLRFTGGMDKGKILLIPGIPFFNIGDHTILFVKENKIRICPVVGWYQGRFRIIGEKIFSNYGREIWLTDKGNLVHGKYHLLKEVLSHRFLDTELRLIGSDVKREGKIQQVKTSEKQLNYKTFTEFIRVQIKKQISPDELLELKAVESANIKDNFYFKLPAKIPPEATKEKEAIK